MAPLAAWSPTETVVESQQPIYLAAIAPHDAYWLGFEADDGLSFAVTVDVEGRNALTGQKGSTPSLVRQPKNFLLIPDQPWLDAMAGPRGRPQQLIPRFDHQDRALGIATGGEIHLTIYAIAAEALDPPLLPRPQGPVPQYAQDSAPSEGEPRIHPWVGRNLHRDVQAPCACAQLTVAIVEPQVFESLTAVSLPKGLFDDVNSTPPPPVQLF